MKWYADRPSRFLRQVLADVVVLAWMGAWIWLGAQVHDTVQRLRAPGDKLVDAGSGLRDTFHDAAASAGKVPLVGGQLADTLGTGVNAGSTLVNAGHGEIDIAESLAFWLPVALVLGPVLFALAIWLPLRLRYARSAGAARRIGRLDGGEDLLALRALTRLPLRSLATVSDDPAVDWRKGRRKVIGELAALEQNSLGLRRTG
ncbi:hypothetical protein [Kutzneria buriramensis]|uniref:Transmembrane protein n=1 Tax=Kutzneria buriramensis TaxID=1045776 RepID=A0A3E0I5M1_9PSEU|nr:hypothetical protein [Kutzneria buriramensis]REH53937.1 hypothetical protein BCF44_102158 [Kutzneria buriramensis]